MIVLQIHLYRIEACLGPNKTSIQLARPKYAYQMQPPEVVYKKAVLKSFAKFTGTHLYQSLFFDKTAVWNPATLRKRECGKSAFI